MQLWRWSRTFGICREDLQEGPTGTLRHKLRLKNVGGIPSLSGKPPLTKTFKLFKSDPPR